MTYHRITCPDGADCTNLDHQHAPDDPEGDVWTPREEPLAQPREIHPDRSPYPLTGQLPRRYVTADGLGVHAQDRCGLRHRDQPGRLEGLDCRRQRRDLVP
jgi:hypothetical protein